MKGDTFEIKVRGIDNKALYKDKIPINNQKKLNNVFNILKYKFDIYYKKIKGGEEKGWFDD